jgi:hypothetical protein
VGDRDLEVTGWSLVGDKVVIRLTGTDTPPAVAPLAADLAKAFAAPVDLDVVYTPVVREHATAAP